MQLLKINVGSVSMQLTEAELILVNNTLNEVLNGIKITEFQTRLGLSREAAQKLLNEIGSLLDKIKERH